MAIDRRTLVKSATAVTAGSIAGLSGCLGGDSEDLELRVSVAAPEETTVGQAVTRFSEIVEEKSDGEITSELFYGDELGAYPEQLEQVRQGSIDLSTAGPSFIDSFGVPGLGVLDGAYLYGSFEKALEVLDPNENDLMADFAEQSRNEAGYEIVNPFPRETRHLSLNAEACTPEELSDTRIRTAGAEAYQANVAGLGASPAEVASTEIAQALATGQVDGVDQAISFLALDYIFENQSHLLLTGHLKQCLWYVVGSDRWEAFSSDQQNLITESTADVREERLNNVEQDEDDIKQEIREGGLEIVEPQPDACIDREAFRETAIENHRDAFSEHENVLDQVFEF